jgi:radical SAM protein with 4Fe4S-binding SPASM domain
VVKPYSQHPRSRTERYRNVRYDDCAALQKRLERYNGGGFDAIVRVNTMRKWQEAKHPYRACMALPFWAHIDSGGNVWGCPSFFGDKRFLYGNILTQTFRQVWNSAVKRRLMDNFCRMVNIDHCRVNCRMDEVNRFLWSLNHPPAHVNFV